MDPWGTKCGQSDQVTWKFPRTLPTIESATSILEVRCLNQLRHRSLPHTLFFHLCLLSYAVFTSGCTLKVCMHQYHSTCVLSLGHITEMIHLCRSQRRVSYDVHCLLPLEQLGRSSNHNRDVDTSDFFLISVLFLTDRSLSTGRSLIPNPTKRL